MFVHNLTFGVARGRSEIEVSVEVVGTPGFRDVWRSYFPGQSSRPASRLAGEVTAFVCRAGGPPKWEDGLIRIFLEADWRLTQTTYRAESVRNRVSVWVSPHKNNPAWGSSRHYENRPLLPSYAVRNPREAVVAGVAHEVAHCLSLGRRPGHYWRDARAHDGTEFVCELVAVTALEVFCPRRKNRIKKI